MAEEACGILLLVSLEIDLREHPANEASSRSPLAFQRQTVPNPRIAMLKMRKRSTTTRDRNLQFWVAVSTGFLEISPVDFFPLLQVYCVI